jgi:hypothetical protein
MIAGIEVSPAVNIERIPITRLATAEPGAGCGIAGMKVSAGAIACMACERFGAAGATGLGGWGVGRKGCVGRLAWETGCDGCTIFGRDI